MFIALTRAAFWVAVAISAVGALRPLPFDVGLSSDKVAHILAFATLSVLGRLAYGKVGPLHLAGVLALYGVLIETVQAIPALNRDSSGMDMIADWAAVAGALLLFAGAKRVFSGAPRDTGQGAKIDIP